MQITLKKILCPVDFSDNSTHALDYAIAFAQANDADLTLFHVVDIPVLASLDYPIIVANINDVATSAQRRLDKLVEEVRHLHERTSCHVVVGQPFMEIIQFARVHEMDLIVLGTHGSTGLAHVLMGSVSERVVRKSPCPVLTIRHPGHEFVMP